MTIYIQSCGRSQNHDYRWLEVRTRKPEIPSELKKLQPEELIDSQKSSIILARLHNCSKSFLVLLITALKTRDGRTDFVGRQIRNSVAWVEIDSDEKERQLRKIAIQALKGDLAGVVDEAVENNADSDYGFEADFTKLRAIGSFSDSLDIGFEEEEPNVLKFGENNDLFKPALVLDLTKYSLPKLAGDIQILVVVTTMKSLEGLKSRGVWRGLSSRIESEVWIKSEAQIEPEASEVYYTPGKKPRSARKVEVENSNPILGIIILLIIGAMVMTIWLLLHNAASQNPKTKSVTPVQPNVTSSSQPKTNSQLQSATSVQSDATQGSRTETSLYTPQIP